ncbi:Hpt domain-containing protein [Flavobacterium sp.]|uniref:Hpt domain-containing protein n=1 Tax=Flavobacterium sp. TaxID=239 RepID=UPI002624D34E|nr:Hpt domain-containing protein [Flavobacterium sp.]
MMYENPNLDYLEQLAAGDLTVRKTIYALMVNEFDSDFEAYKKAKLQNDAQACIALVHRLKHKIGFLGMEYSYQIANRYEVELRRNSDRFAAEFDAVLDQIHEFIQKTPQL